MTADKWRATDEQLLVFQTLRSDPLHPERLEIEAPHNRPLAGLKRASDQLGGCRIEGGREDGGRLRRAVAPNPQEGGLVEFRMECTHLSVLRSPILIAEQSAGPSTACSSFSNE